MKHCKVVLLAAGKASRYGDNKFAATHPHSGLPLIHHVITQYQLAGLDDITVVSGFWHEQLVNLLPQGVTLHFAPDWEEGIAASLRCATTLMSAQSDALVIGLGDQAGLTAEMISALLKQSLDSPSIIASAYEQIIGPPVIFPRDKMSMLQSLSGDQGAGKLLRKMSMAQSNELVVVPFTSILDIDTPQDWQKLD